MGKVSQLESMVKLLQDDLKKVSLASAKAVSNSIVRYINNNSGRHYVNVFLLCLHQEKDAKASLQAQIQSLREDNQRLLEESYSASAKLKKFTEWVFNTIDMN